MRYWALLTWCLISVGAAPNLVAQNTAQFTANVLEILIDDTDFGGCMARLSTDPEERVATCGTAWVTFDCLAAFPNSTKGQAQAKLGAAQLAYVTGNTVRVTITDASTANGKCLASKIRNN